MGRGWPWEDSSGLGEGWTGWGGEGFLFSAPGYGGTDCKHTQTGLGSPQGERRVYTEGGGKEGSPHPSIPLYISFFRPKAGNHRFFNPIFFNMPPSIPHPCDRYRIQFDVNLPLSCLHAHSSNQIYI